MSLDYVTCFLSLCTAALFSYIEPLRLELLVEPDRWEDKTGLAAWQNEAFVFHNSSNKRMCHRSAPNDPTRSPRPHYALLWCQINDWDLSTRYFTTQKVYKRLGLVNQSEVSAILAGQHKTSCIHRSGSCEDLYLRIEKGKWDGAVYSHFSYFHNGRFLSASHLFLTRNNHAQNIRIRNGRRVGGEVIRPFPHKWKTRQACALLSKGLA